MQQNSFLIKRIALFCCLFCQSLIQAQEPGAFFKQVRQEYPDDSFVQLSREIDYQIDITKGQLDIILKEKEKYIYLKNLKGYSQDRSVYSTSFVELIDLEAYSLVPNGKKYKKIKVNDYMEKVNMDTDSFHDDITEYIISFPSISEGTILELNTIHKIHDPRLLPTIHLAQHVPVRDFALRVTCDNNIDLDFIPINIPEGQFKIEQEEAKGQILYSCFFKNADRINYEPFEPGLGYYIPHYIPIIKSYHLKDQTHQVLSGCDDLYNWYYTFIDDIYEKEYKGGIRQTAETITTGYTSEKEKVMAIYYWVQSNIKYLAFEYGLGGLVPRLPEVTLLNRYGDCKDKSALLYAMLKSIGIQSYLTWIGTTGLPYTYSKVPSPKTDNHMIVVYKNNDTAYFLDGTANLLSLQYPSANIQGKEALVAIDKTNYEIIKVPVTEPHLNLIVDSANLMIENNKLLGKGHTVFTGYPAKEYKNDLIRAKPDRFKQLLEDYLTKGSNKFVLQDFTTSDLQTFDPRLAVDYSFHLDNYIQSIQNDYYLNLNLNQSWAKFQIKDTRKHPLQLPFCQQTIDVFTLQVPEAYGLVYIPDDQNYTGDGFSFHINYTRDSAQVVYRQEVVVSKLLIEENDFDKWIHFTDALEKAYKQTIILRKYE